MSQTICRACAAEDAVGIEAVHRGRVVASGALCSSCCSAAHVRAAELREIYEALISAGVSRGEANALVIAMIDGRGVSA